MDNDFDRLTRGVRTAEGKISETEHTLVGSSNTENQREQRQNQHNRGQLRPVGNQERYNILINSIEEEQKESMGNNMTENSQKLLPDANHRSFHP